MKTYSHALRKFVNCDEFSEDNFDRSSKIQPQPLQPWMPSSQSSSSSSSTERWGMAQTENTADCNGTKLTMTSSRGNGFSFCAPSNGSKPTLTFGYPVQSTQSGQSQGVQSMDRISQYSANSQSIHPAQRQGGIAGCGDGGFGFGGRRRELNLLASTALLGSSFLPPPIIPTLAFPPAVAAFPPAFASYAPPVSYAPPAFAYAPPPVSYAPPQFAYAPPPVSYSPPVSYAPQPQFAAYSPPPVQQQQPVYNLAPPPPVQVNQLPPTFVKMPDTVTIQGPTVEVPGNNYTVSAEQGAQMHGSSGYSLPQGTTTFNTSMVPASSSNVMSAVQMSPQQYSTTSYGTAVSSRPPGC